MKTYKEWEAEMINAYPQFYKCTEEVLKRRLYEQYCLNCYDKARKETAKEILDEISKYLKCYAHIHKYAQEAKELTEQYADGEPVEMESVWDVITLNKNGHTDYETMNTLQDNIENIANSLLLREFEKDFRIYVKKYGVEVDE